MAWYDDPAWKYGNDTRAGSWHSVAPAVAEPQKLNPLSTIGLTPGYTPNYRDLVLSDPSYLSWQNTGTLDVNQAAARRRAALQALVVRYGGVGNVQDAYGDIDDTTRDLASRNQFSDLARISRNYTQGVEAYKKALAARRGLSSGELQYGLDQADYARGASEYDFGQEFSSAAQMAINDYLGVEGGVRRGEPAALSQAQENVYRTYAPEPGTEARLDPDWQTKYGVPVYVGPDGGLYVIGADGNPVSYSPREVPQQQATYQDPYWYYEDQARGF